MAREETSNQFSDGLLMDLHPLLSPNTALTDNLNGTFITYDGNEYVLQNDRGNYPLKNCKLKPNYVPIGVKEYGDIIYIVSYNPIEDITEIGSYPSPLDTVSSNADDEFVYESPINTYLKSESFNNTVSFHELNNLVKPFIFYKSKDGEDMLLNPGDMYSFQMDEVENKAAVEFLETFVLDLENNPITVDNLDVTTELGVKKYTTWSIPGYLGVRWKVLSPSDFKINIPVFYANVYNDQTSLKCNINFQVFYDDCRLSENVDFAIGVHYEIMKNEVLVKTETIYPQTWNKMQYWDEDGLLHFNMEDVTISGVELKDNIAIYAYPIIKVQLNSEELFIEYEHLIDSVSNTIEGISSSSEFIPTSNIWKYKVDSNETIVQFDVSGPTIINSEEELLLKYDVFDLNNKSVKSGEINSFSTSNLTSLSLLFDDRFVKENIYYIKLWFNEDLILERPLITSIVFNDFFYKVDDFRTISLNEWSGVYFKHIHIDKQLSFTYGDINISNTGLFTGSNDEVLKVFCNPENTAVSTILNDKYTVSKYNVGTTSIQTQSTVDRLMGPLWDQLTLQYKLNNVISDSLSFDDVSIKVGSTITFEYDPSTIYLRNYIQGNSLPYEPNHLGDLVCKRVTASQGVSVSFDEITVERWNYYNTFPSDITKRLRDKIDSNPNKLNYIEVKLYSNYQRGVRLMSQEYLSSAATSNDHFFSSGDGVVEADDQDYGDTPVIGFNWFKFYVFANSEGGVTLVQFSGDPKQGLTLLSGDSKYVAYACPKNPIIEDSLENTFEILGSIKSWTYNGKDLPYLGNSKIFGNLFKGVVSKDVITCFGKINTSGLYGVDLQTMFDEYYSSAIQQYGDAKLITVDTKRISGGYFNKVNFDWNNNTVFVNKGSNSLWHMLVTTATSNTNKTKLDWGTVYIAHVLNDVNLD